MSNPSQNTPAMTPDQMRVAVLYVQGWPKWRIALECGFTEAGVEQAIKSIAVQQFMHVVRTEVASAAKDVVTKLMGAAPQAAETVIALMQGAKDERVQLNAAKDLLDRAGHGAVKRVDVQSTNRGVNYNFHALAPEEQAVMRDLAEKALRNQYATQEGNEHVAGIPGPADAGSV